MTPITINDIADFIQMVITSFSDPLYYVLVMLIGFAVAYHVKELLVSGSR